MQGSSPPPSSWPPRRAACRSSRPERVDSGSPSAASGLGTKGEGFATSIASFHSSSRGLIQSYVRVTVRVKRPTSAVEEAGKQPRVAHDLGGRLAAALLGQEPPAVQCGGRGGRSRCCCCCRYITWELGERFNAAQATTDQTKERQRGKAGKIKQKLVENSYGVTSEEE